MGCKICDKKDSATTLGHSPILSVEDAPCDFTLRQFCHSCVRPFAVFRHWNLGLSDFLEHGPKVHSFVAAERSRHVLPDEEPRIPSSGGTSHGTNNVNCSAKQTASCTVQSLPSARDAQVLARTACTDNVHGRDRRPVNLRNVPKLLDLGEMPRRHRARKRLDLACPDRRNARMTRRK